MIFLIGCMEPNSDVDCTMEKLPTTLPYVVRYSDEPTIHSFTIVSSKYPNRFDRFNHF